MIRLNQKDKELLKTGKTINLSDPAYAYMGGEFRTNEEDYLEVLIHDTNNNFLESAVVDRQDYYKRGADHETTPNMIVIRTGTILRKMGYDRGTFIVKYNFLRNIAGSYETVLVDRNDVVWPGNYHNYKGGLKSGLAPENPDESGNRLDLFLKDFKYYIHEISPSRKEIRLAPQNIKDRGANKYLRNFYLAGKTRETVIGTGTEDAQLEFVGNDKANSRTLKFNSPDASFDRKFVGGSFVIPKAYILNYTTIPQSQPPSEYQVFEEREGEMRARFYFDRESSFTEQNNSNGSLGDQFFGRLIQVFDNNGDGFNEGDSINSVPSAPFIAAGLGTERSEWADYVGGSTLLTNTRRWTDGSPGMDVITMGYRTGVNNTIVIRSNSILPNLEIPTTYTWEITGWDVGNAGDSDSVERIYPRESGGADDGSNGGDFILLGPDAQDPTVATPKGDLHQFQAVTQNSTDGATFAFQLASRDVVVGIKLTVEQALGDGTNASSTIWLPACIQQPPLED